MAFFLRLGEAELLQTGSRSVRTPGPTRMTMSHSHGKIGSFVAADSIRSAPAINCRGQPVEKPRGVRGPQPPEALIGFGDMRVKSAKALRSKGFLA